MADEINAGESTQVSDREMDISFSGPAIACNRFFATLTPGGAMRIAFAEQRSPDAEPVFRSAIIFSMQDAIAFRNLLIRLLKEPEAAIEEAMSAQEAQKPDG